MAPDSAAPLGFDSELDSFRRQWISDLLSRNSQPSAPPAARPPYTDARAALPKATSPAPHGRHATSYLDDGDDDYLQGRTFDDPPPLSSSGHALSESVNPAQEPPNDLVSALDHYEAAMEKEAQGNMGDSLRLYRQAYRLDNRVDKRYREKHFPVVVSSEPKPTPAASSSTPSSAAAAQPSPSGMASDAPEPLSTADLVASFASLSIQPAPPSVENTPPPPCPISLLPAEILIHILSDLAALDPGALCCSAALVCKRFAYLAATEDLRIWRRVALDGRFGFGGMHYRFRRSVDWDPVEAGGDNEGGGAAPDDAVHQMLHEGIVPAILDTQRDGQDRLAHESLLFSRALIPKAYASWQHMFRARPRVRFNGCYISTVNYIRTGQMSTNQATWGGSPVHIVTYYRYLRFFRDGTCISLLTTCEPVDVVHHLTLEQLRLHRDREHAHGHLPSAPMRLALKGRWRLSPSLDRPTSGRTPSLLPPLSSSPSSAAAPWGIDGEHEGDLVVETEGVGPKYMYRMDLALRSAGRAARNNKVIWRGFHSYNKLTDDWAEFRLKHDKPFFFSRVRSYGMGE
ncbi:hypothetical protein DCS_04627 [Drechmeria coniospora]|uniref:F-box domain-containing protein n=1 Tax=Drechmeria coniospora TaxID=98403 RepID=A0A151GKK0_DRECN|nr:hypothetical protein DCS_04627 [Drechmeria coniospora]KYK57616.1 hypothetical protein DCS_04627 [Drechmeria coniospora]